MPALQAVATGAEDGSEILPQWVEPDVLDGDDLRVDTGLLAAAGSGASALAVGWGASAVSPAHGASISASALSVVSRATASGPLSRVGVARLGRGSVDRSKCVTGDAGALAS